MTTSGPQRRQAAAAFFAVLLGACAINPPTQPLDPQINLQLRKLADADAGACNAAPDAAQSQFLIGYGSLMQDESRKRTAPGAGAASPVFVKGFRRGWFAAGGGGGVGFDTTYLGAVPDALREFNAVLYKVDAPELAATDQRESFYCRRAVDPAAVTMLDREQAPAQGQIWIYLNRPDSIAVPTERDPIVQSYVDIFVSGCLELEQRHRLAGFAARCLTTTTDWSAHWVSDRIYPRRPFIHQPKARQIDKLLNDTLPQFFRGIKIESAR